MLPSISNALFEFETNPILVSTHSFYYICLSLIIFPFDF